MKLVFKFFWLIVVGLILATISACSSVKKHKFKSKDTIIEKVEEKKEEVITNSVNKESIITKEKQINEYIKNTSLDIKYTPTYDINGNSIPFHYEKEENGNKTKVTISGPGEVISSDNTNEIKQLSRELEEANSRIDSLNKKLSAVKGTTVVESSHSEKTTDKAPDYIKYVIWILIGIVVIVSIIYLIKIAIKKSIFPFKF